MKKLLIVGGGFAGMAAALAARAEGRNEVAVQLVSRDTHLTIRPRLYEAAPERFAIDLAATLAEAGVAFCQAAVDAIEPKAVRLSDGTAEAFDGLIVATGSRMERPPVYGADQAFSIDTLEEAIAFDARLRAIADQERVTIAIVGAGFAGIELALEMRDRLKEHGAASDGARARIILLDRTEEVGGELGAPPRPLIVEALDAASIERRLGIAITAVSDTGIWFADGDRLEADAVILCTGLVAAPLAQMLAGTHDRLGRLIVDQYLRAPFSSHIFVAGDAAAAECAPGHVTLMSCQHARASGEAAGRNAARHLLGMELEPYEQQRYVTCLDLGRSGAMFSEGWSRVPLLSGTKAKQMKQLINRKLIYPPGHPADDYMPAEPAEFARA